MCRNHLKLLILLAFQGITLSSAYAQSAGIASLDAATEDSVIALPFLITERNFTAGLQKIPSVPSAEKELWVAKEKNNLSAEVKALLGVSDAYISFGHNRKAFIQLRRLLKMKHQAGDENAVAHLYYNMAVVMARIKNYPVALSCFYKAGNMVPQFAFKKKHGRMRAVDSSFRLSEQGPVPNEDSADTEEPEAFSDSMIDASLLALDTLQIPDRIKDSSATVVNSESVIDAFADNKKGSAYAVAIHIKQPVAGKKKAFFKLGQVGHMYITLIKFNEDKTVVSKTFGFYPQKGSLFPVNPLFPSIQATLKNDAVRNWDEMIGRFVTQKNFTRILSFIDESLDKDYHLSKFNCSDFALGVAGLADIQIEETSGTWPLGRGNNPGCAGQSVLSGKFKNLETNSLRGLFACTNNLFASEK